jgi:spore coat protein U-like protein
VRIDISLFALALLFSSVAPANALLICGSGLPFASAVIVSATDLSFGNYTPASNALASADVSVRCGALGIDLLPSFTVSLTALNGTNPMARYLDKVGTHLAYNVHTNSSYSNATIWGDGTNGSVIQSYSALLLLGSIHFTAWGKLSAGQYVAAGLYTDKITVTVSY